MSVRILLLIATIDRTLCNDVDLLKALQKFNLTPVVIQRPPHKVLQIIYPGDLTIQPGLEVLPEDVMQPPTIKWPTNATDYNCLYVTGTSETFFYELPTPGPNMTKNVYVPIRHEWLHWVVGNIPGDKIKKGDVLRDYQKPHVPGYDVVDQYLFLIFKQPGRIRFGDLRTKKEEQYEFSHLHAFRRYYNLSRPVYGNFFIIKGPKNTPSTPDPDPPEKVYSTLIISDSVEKRGKELQEYEENYVYAPYHDD